MGRFLAARLLRLLATLLVVAFLTFYMTSLLPGDPALLLLPPDNITPETIAAVRADLGLDKPIYQQFVSWIGDALTGDLGRSYRTNELVLDSIKNRLPVTLQLAVFALGFALIVAVPLGILSAFKQGRAADRAISWFVQVLLSVPVFVSGVFLQYYFAVEFGLLPATSWTRLTNDPVENLKHAVLPALTLALIEIAVYTRLVRADMISTLQENYILSARAKGLTSRYILFRHAFRPSSLSLITVVGLNIGTLLGGTVIVEQLFALPGLGGLLLDSILSRDLVVVQGLVLFISTVYVVVNTLVDFVYAAVDPRIRLGSE